LISHMQHLSALAHPALANVNWNDQMIGQWISD
jgi:hypothetical protein